MSDLYDLWRDCRICPHQCGVNRFRELGFCQAPIRYKNRKPYVKINLYQPFFFEEPIITGEHGSGNIFFSHCNLRCRFCQNHAISQHGDGYFVSIDRLAEIIGELIQRQCRFINFVSPTPYLPLIAALLKRPERFGDSARIVYNSNAYEEVSALVHLDQRVDIYLPDYKYADPDLGQRLSGIRNYPDKALLAICEMVRQTGAPMMDDDGLMVRGTLIRHLVLPHFVTNSLDAMGILSGHLADEVMISLMAQYTPMAGVADYPELNRKITREEYQRVVDRLQELDKFNGFTQELDSSDTCYIPKFGSWKTGGLL